MDFKVYLHVIMQPLAYELMKVQIQEIQSKK